MKTEEVKELMVWAGFIRTKYSPAYGRLSDLIEARVRREALEENKTWFLSGYDYGWNAALVNEYNPAWELTVELRRMEKEIKP